jgi:hypothetical protein
MEDVRYWSARAAEMRDRASKTKDPFIASRFLSLAEQYEQLEAYGARWLDARGRPSSSPPSPIKRAG